MHVTDIVTSSRVEIINGRPHVMQEGTSELGTVCRFLPDCVVDGCVECSFDDREWHDRKDVALSDAHDLVSKSF